MRLSNRNSAPYFHFLSTLVVMISMFGGIAFLLEHFVYNYLELSEYLFLIIPGLIALIFYMRGRQIFEYDSDGEALNFKNRNVFLFIDKNLNDEFPKYKLISYEIINAIFLKKLFITITSKKNSSLILKYDISYLKKREISDLQMSLSKVIKANKERENS